MEENPLMKENESSCVGKGTIFLIIAFILVSAFINISQNHVPHPSAFIIAAIGFVLFLFAKINNFSKRDFISFRTKNMSENMANIYRLGYWLMIVGIMLTFADF